MTAQQVSRCTLHSDSTCGLTAFREFAHVSGTSQPQTSLRVLYGNAKWRKFDPLSILEIAKGTKATSYVDFWCQLQSPSLWRPSVARHFDPVWHPCLLSLSCHSAAWPKLSTPTLQGCSPHRRLQRRSSASLIDMTSQCQQCTTPLSKSSWCNSTSCATTYGTSMTRCGPASIRGCGSCYASLERRCVSSDHRGTETVRGMSALVRTVIGMPAVHRLLLLHMPEPHRHAHGGRTPKPPGAGVSIRRNAAGAQPVSHVMNWIALPPARLLPSAAAGLRHDASTSAGVCARHLERLQPDPR
jgi:hypothetical protein